MRPLLPNKKAAAAKSIIPLTYTTIPKIQATETACNPCRKRKIKCDGVHPHCYSCKSRGLDCSWPTLGKSTDVLKQLQRLPYDEAIKVLQQLRGMELPESSSSGSSSNDFLPSISEYQILRSCIPSTPNDLEFELAIRHPIAYPTLLPVNIDSLKDQTFLYSQKSLRSIKKGSSSAVGPQNHATLIDDRLGHLEMRYWSAVPISNDLAARIISHYLEIDYPVLPMFNKELFLNDLVNNMPNFCSPLLVSALLSWACQAYSSLDQSVRFLGAAFFVEAEDILKRQDKLNSLTTVAALQLISMTAETHGRNALALQYRQEGMRVGEAMGLFNVQSTNSSAEMWVQGYDEWKIAASYTAWGTFNFATIRSVHHNSIDITIPPLLPMPGDVELEAAKAKGDDSYLSTDVLVFRALCQLWVTYHQTILATRSSSPSITENPVSTLLTAEASYHQFLLWAAKLPLELARSIEDSYAVLAMHMIFHAVITNIFRPFLTGADIPERLLSFHAPNASPTAAFAASINQLKRLVLLARIYFPMNSCSALGKTSLLYVANAMMAEVSSPDLSWQFYLRLCFVGFEDLHQAFRVYGTLSEAVLGMALQHNAITKRQASAAKRELAATAELHRAVADLCDGKIDTECVIDLDLALRDYPAAQIKPMADKFRALDLEEIDSAEE